jgi:hypothetical protein
LFVKGAFIALLLESVATVENAVTRKEGTT